ncbi:NADP-dependent 3-hydroxy acid dehydrogenase YdfG [Arthrobacter pigmenti]|uniref:NADP-dependent 3-hydroxy acid dehydrogenase YdfG n=1 Tax=Arthrobacter pigmenti TaxID=271432 RepID=A0A846RW58_9MICC|nr:NADP-dependent 3-hydroxy acid dehydrogenase YdfG [Arthrobacter pigmenti]
MSDHSSLHVLIAGATSQAGIATAEALSAAGAKVIAVGSDSGRLQSALGHMPTVELRTCNLADAAAVGSLAARLRDEGIAVDGLIHLVGGWRGGSGIEGQAEEDYEFLHTSVLTTLRNTTRSFVSDLERSARGRLAIVSATAVDQPTAGNASYAAVKAAAETWVRAVAHEFAGQSESDAKGPAAAIVVVKALLDDGMQAARPDRRFPGYTHVRDLAATLAGLFDQAPAAINGQRLVLAD